MLTKEEVLKRVKVFIEEISEGRIDGEVKDNACLLEEYSFSSIDIMDLLIKVREAFFSDKDDLDVGILLNDIFVDYENGSISANEIAEIIMKNKE